MVVCKCWFVILIWCVWFVVIVVSVGVIVIVNKKELMIVRMILIVMELMNFLVGLGIVVIGVNVSVVVNVELKRGIVRCCMLVLIVLSGFLLCCNVLLILLMMIIVLLISSLSVMINFVIDIWWIGMFIMWRLVSIISEVSGKVVLIIIVFC